MRSAISRCAIDGAYKNYLPQKMLRNAFVLFTQKYLYSLRLRASAVQHQVLLA
jgi:hypothetical protein